MSKLCYISLLPATSGPACRMARLGLRDGFSRLLI